MSGELQTQKWGAVVSVRFPAPLLKLLDKLVVQRQAIAGVRALAEGWSYNDGRPQSSYESGAPEAEALKEVLGSSWVHHRDISRSSMLHDLVMMAAGLAKLAEMPKRKKPKKKKAKKARKGARR